MSWKPGTGQSITMSPHIWFKAPFWARTVSSWRVTLTQRIPSSSSMSNFAMIV